MRNRSATPTGSTTSAGAGPATDPAAGRAAGEIDAALDEALHASADDHVVALLAPVDMNPFEFSIACEVFGIRRGEVLARMETPQWYDLRVVAADPSRPVPTPFGFQLQVERGLEELAVADTVIVPMAPKPAVAESQRIGWRMPDLPDGEVVEAIAAAAARGARMVSFCSGAFLLAEAGVLDGRRATTHWMYAESFRRRYPRVELVPDVLWVDEGQVLTSAGSAAGADLSLHIVRQDHGSDAADGVARRMVVPPHRDGGQAQFTTPPPQPVAGEPFAELTDWMIANLERDLTVAELAARVTMSPRTFARRFRDATGTTPYRWLVARRVDRARQLLETTDMTVEAVASRSGLGSAANLRTRLDEVVGVSPSTYRQRFRRT